MILSNRGIYAILLAAFMVLFSFIAKAAELPTTPPDGIFFVDEASLIDPLTETKINTVAGTLLAEEQVPIYVVTIRSLASKNAITMDIEDYAAHVFDRWGIGSQDRNYGVLLLISKADRKARIELGAAWNNQYDDQAEQVMQRLIIPEFRRGNFSAGIEDGVNGLDRMVRGLELIPGNEFQYRRQTLTQSKPFDFSALMTKDAWPIWLIILGGGALLFAALVDIAKVGTSGWGYIALKVIGFLILVPIMFLLAVMVLGGGGDGDYDGGFGGGGFGGGSSGGGGATGSW